MCAFLSPHDKLFTIFYSNENKKGKTGLGLGHNKGNLLKSFKNEYNPRQYTTHTCTRYTLRIRRITQCGGDERTGKGARACASGGLNSEVIFWPTITYEYKRGVYMNLLYVLCAVVMCEIHDHIRYLVPISQFAYGGTSATWFMAL